MGTKRKFEGGEEAGSNSTPKKARKGGEEADSKSISKKARKGGEEADSNLTSEKARKGEEEAGSNSTSKKARKGFTVGPANLPDGTYKRKAQKIKQSLIHKAKLKKDYAKIKEREILEHPETFKSVYQNANADSEEPAKLPTLEIHPERLAMLNNPEAEPEPHSSGSKSHWAKRKNKRHKPQPFEKEGKMAQKRKKDAEAKQQAFNESEKQRKVKSQEREKFRKVMAKARSGGKNGQRKLGLESKVLLEKTKRTMSE